MRTFQRRLTSCALAAALGALAAGAAYAVELGPKHGASRDAAPDLPGLSREECDKRFTEYDANHDGKLTYKEFAEGRFGEIRFASAPSESEVRSFISRYTAIARKADVNHDGHLTRREHLPTCSDGNP